MRTRRSSAAPNRKGDRDESKLAGVFLSRRSAKIQGRDEEKRKEKDTAYQEFPIILFPFFSARR
jgi:hypothetical protein